MKIRTQLVLAFFLLAVVPLASIVLYSYITSFRAVQRAVREEANVRTREMEQRMGATKIQLGRRVEGLSRLPLRALLRRSGADISEEALLSMMASQMGDLAPLVMSLTLTPGAPQPPVLVEAPELPERPQPPEVEVLEIDMTSLMELAETEAARQVESLDRQVEMMQQRSQNRERWRAIASIRAEDLRRMEEKRRRTERLLGQEFATTIRDEDGIVGEVQAEISPEQLVQRVLAATPREPGEILFALDAEGTIYPEQEADKALLENLELYRDVESDRVRSRRGTDEWVIGSTLHPASNLLLGVAHPIGDSLAEIRATSWSNLIIGLGFVGLALLGILPLAKRITHGLETVTEGAAQIARGDLTTRVPVSSKNEIGQLATAFNHMAEDLSKQRQRLIQKGVIEAELERKSQELEDAREFQISLLPKTLPDHPSLELAVDMRTATEVGGDYYDFIHHQVHHQQDMLTLAIGDATGHGARAGTMVTVIKSLFTSSAADLPPNEFLLQAAHAIKRMDLGRMAMALTVARFEGDHLVFSAAGMPPVLLYRAATDEIEELILPGMPLGSLASDYTQRRLELSAGDTLLFLSDGLPELPNAEGDPLGYAAVRNVFARVAARPPKLIIDEMIATAERWTHGNPPSDDMTFVVVQKKV